MEALAAWAHFFTSLVAAEVLRAMTQSLTISISQEIPINVCFGDNVFSM